MFIDVSPYLEQAGLSLWVISQVFFSFTVCFYMSGFIACGSVYLIKMNL